jgi:predicted  nucleic acid-binding Zn-ribbon protein
MTNNINIEINGKDVSDKNSTSLLAFETHIDNLHLSRHEGEMMRKQIKAITNSYLDLIPKRSRTGEPRDTVTIPRKEYEEMKATIATQSKQIEFLMMEVKELRKRVSELEFENTELRNVCDKYFAAFGPLPNDSL